jgi:hypothetical protein
MPTFRISLTAPEAVAEREAERNRPASTIPFAVDIEAANVREAETAFRRAHLVDGWFLIPVAENEIRAVNASQVISYRIHLIDDRDARKTPNPYR